MARGQPKQVRLKFSQSLKGVATTELQKRLRALHDELSEIDQDLIVTSSLHSVAKDLISTTLLLHKDKGVKAYLACCLADILRLYAPEAPYTEKELKDLFQFLFQQLKHVGVQTDPHYAEYFYLIESLSNVKSIVLICDLDSADELMTEIFKQSFDTINSNSPKNVEICVADILMQLLEEAQTLSSDVIETILAQFLPKAVKSNSAAHRLAVDVCSGAADKLQRYVCQHFAEVITSTISGVNEDGSDDDDSDEEDDDSDDSTAAAKKKRKANKKKGAATSGAGKVTSTMLDKVALPTDFIRAHELIQSINKSVPSLLLNVIPQIEEELSADKPEYRRLATSVLGQMLGEKIGQGDVAAKYPGTWKTWLQRSRDKAPAVKIAMVESVRKIWTEHPELAQDLGDTVEKIMLDTDDKVRISACSVFEAMDLEVAFHHVKKRTLLALSERCKDRKHSVRAVAFKSLGRLYDLAYSEIESRDPNAIEQFGWIPGHLLEPIKYAVNEPSMQNSIRASIEGTLLQYIVPQPKKEEDEQAWVDRFLLVFSSLNQDDAATILSMTRLAIRRPSMYDAYIIACERYNGGIIDADEEAVKNRLKSVVQAIAASSGDPAKTAEDLNKFAKANEGQIYKLMKQLLDPQTDLKTMLKAHREYSRRIDQISFALVDTFAWLIRSSAYLLINRSSVPSLLKRLQMKGDGNGTLARSAGVVLEYVSSHRPALYKAHTAELTKALSGENAKDDKLVEISLHALSQLNKTERSTTIDKKLAERASHFARSGTPRQAKHAATIVALDKNRLNAVDELVDHFATTTATAAGETLVANLSALARIARHAIDSFENQSETISELALEILTRKSVPGEVQDDLSWVEDSELDPLAKARVLVVKLFTNRCLAYAETESAEQAAEPVFKMLWPLLQPYDEDSSKYTPSTASRLRLAAAQSMLKLATCQKYQSSIARSFELLARTAQDECYEVRSGFINKLLAYLRTNRITSAPRYNMVLFLVAHDPEDELRLSVQHFVRSRLRLLPPNARQAQLEHPFVRLLHLLAHHPDFEGEEHDEDEIATMAKYIEFYLECIATQENVPYLFHLALKVKTVGDAVSSAYEPNLYILSELAQHLIKLLAASHHWALPTFPSAVTMPSDIFKLMRDKPTAAKVAKNVYLSESMLSKVHFKPAAKVRAVAAAGASNGNTATTTVPKKRRSPKPKTESSKPKKVKKKNTRKSDSDSDEDDGDSDSDEEAGLNDDGTTKAEKKSASPIKPRPKSSRAGLRNGTEKDDEAENKSPSKKSNGMPTPKGTPKKANGVAVTATRSQEKRGSKRASPESKTTRATRRRKVDSDDEMDED